MTHLVGLLVAAALAASGAGGDSRPGTATAAAALPLPRHARALAADLIATDARLRAAVDAWTDRTRRGVPPAVHEPALRQQRIYRRLATRPRLAARTIAAVRDRRVRAEARDVVAAQAALHVLNAPQRTRRAQRMVRLGPARPAATLLAHYREGQRRSGVPWTLLAAVNLVESDFGRLRNDSIAGAQGPMQFMRSTWATYGRGGDVHNPRDAILGAARLLRAAGAPARTGAALHAYNPSSLYVTAVSRYARRMAADPRAYYAFYAWDPPVPRRVRR